MIDVSRAKRHLCCGCGACAQVCPKRCIEMREDGEGFLYPRVDRGNCIACDRCERACPELHPAAARKPLETYAANHPDEEVRLKSSSGGLFTLLAEAVIDRGGVVFGARFDSDWGVVHGYAETKADVSAFRGSKYVQSRMGNAYRDAQQFLEAGREVMFTGTPCQIAGLKTFLRKEYANLLTVDVVCHGVPSPQTWRIYLNEISGPAKGRKNSVLLPAMSLFPEVDGHRPIVSVDFRNKSLGWKKYSFALTLSKAAAAGEKIQFCSHVFTEDPFMQAFLSDLTLRPSCYHCPSKAGRSGSDVTIGDFWGIEKLKPEFDDDKGCSLVLLNSEKAVQLFRSLPVARERVAYAQALAGNRNLERSVRRPVLRNRFMRQCLKRQSLVRAFGDRRGMAFLIRAWEVLSRRVEMFSAWVERRKGKVRCREQK